MFVGEAWRWRGVTAALVASLWLPCFAAPPTNESISNNPPSAPAEEDLSPPLPQPPDEQVIKAIEEIRTVFEKDYRRRGLQRVELVRLLRKQAETETKPAVRFALLCESRDLAADALSAELAMEAVDELIAGFDVDIAAERSAILGVLAKASLDPLQSEFAALHGLDWVEEALDDDDYETAVKLGTSVDTLASRTKIKSIDTRARDTLKRVKSMQLDFGRMQAAMKTLETKPDDPTANTTVGKFHAFRKGDWALGLPYLTKSGDAELAELARRELEVGRSADTVVQMEMGDAWWDASIKASNAARAAYQRRSGVWYRAALPALNGLELARVEKRLAELLPEVENGLLAEYFADGQFRKMVLRRIDPQLNFAWGKSAPAPSVPADEFSVRWVGRIHPPATGEYTLLISADDRVRLWIDKKEVFNCNDCHLRKRIPVKVNLLSTGTPIRIDFVERSGTANMILEWKLPGASELPIPKKAFTH